ncbi:hypothetical protein DUNSADRAFT_1613 [Dunaliella salina]|uniref:Uncharacterized protein n=1 Tax=Dunaliella salina TaxID=3046 RepID=A0ABQ7H8K1_DUNSA|nr:hypothetical protein DUNSADRAFT_1613 [Dunaliella salina]|eukprot:KAF5843186.1 hypothetical protein DUNSADRAFT_1613 [Dunaliella salina]
MLCLGRCTLDEHNHKAYHFKDDHFHNAHFHNDHFHSNHGVSGCACLTAGLGCCAKDQHDCEPHNFLVDHHAVLRMSVTKGEADSSDEHKYDAHHFHGDYFHVGHFCTMINFHSSHHASGCAYLTAGYCAQDEHEYEPHGLHTDHFRCKKEEKLIHKQGATPSKGGFPK